jgi:hypothetical protein
MPDKFSATWVSHSSMSDFLKCPKAYYLKNVYRDPRTNHKIQLVNPALSLGQTVHQVLESLSVLPVQKRFKRSLLDRFSEVWKNVSGKRGGFTNPDQEAQYKERGVEMLRTVNNNPGPLLQTAVKIKADLPHYWLSEQDEIILCGKVDWLEYLPEDDSVHIIDFKTGKREEDANSLQLPIYSLLVHNTQGRKVSKLSYWYIANSSEPVEKPLPDLGLAFDQILQIAKQVKLARKLGRFKCNHGESGCYSCKQLEKVITGAAEYIGESEYHQDMYFIPESSPEIEEESYLV